MKTQKYVAYYRVSTDKQGNSGLGIDAQKDAVNTFINHGDYKILDEYTEKESGKNNDRPMLQKAVNVCKLKNATLVVSKLDRLSRDLHFITSLQKAGIDFIVADHPDMNEITINILAIIAEQERKMASERTKAALAQAKKKGVELGNPCLKQGKRIPGSGNTTNATETRKRNADYRASQFKSIIDDIRQEGHISLRSIASELNNRGFETSRGCKFTATSVKRIMDRCVNL